MKYIRSDTLGMIIFQDHIVHDKMASMLKIKSKNIISAGFVKVDYIDAIHCTGKSISLNKGSIPEDTEQLQQSM